MWASRIGRNTNQAINAATAFMTLATTNTAYQLPVIAVSMLDRGTNSDAVPFAVSIPEPVACSVVAPRQDSQRIINKKESSEQ